MRRGRKTAGLDYQDGRVAKDKPFGMLGHFYWLDFIGADLFGNIVTFGRSPHVSKEVSMQLDVKTNKQLQSELHMLKERVKELETAEVECASAQQALRRAETLLRKVFESGSGLLSVFDKDLRIIYSTWLGNCDTTAEETAGQFPLCHNAHCPDESTHCDFCHIREVIETGKTVIAEKPNSRIGHLEAHAYPLFDDSGSVALVVEKAINVTEREQTEERLRRARDELEIRVAERTVELAEMVDKLQKEIMERERTELALRQSEERYALAVDGANDGIWDIDLLKGEVFLLATLETDAWL